MNAWGRSGWFAGLRVLAAGLCMGVADAVPGVSGGTVALVLGFYRRLLDALAALGQLPTQWRDAEARLAAITALRFLLPLGLGVVLGLLGAVSLLIGERPDLTGLDAAAAEMRLHEAAGWLINPRRAPLVFGLFFGAVAASVPVPWARRRQPRRLDYALLLPGAVIAALLALSPALAIAATWPVLVLGGAVAVTMMLLPGVSGSLALLVLGLYQGVAGAVHDRDLVILLPFALGMALGACLAVPGLRALLARAHDRTMALLSGLMLGSLVALWPWKAHYLPDAIPLLGPLQPVAPGSQWWGPVLCALTAAIVVRAAAQRSRHSTM